MERRRFLPYFTKVLIEIMFFSGIFVCALVPVWIYKIEPHYPIFSIGYPVLKRIASQLMAVLFISGIMSLYILWNIRHIFKTIVYTNPFNLENVAILRKIAVASFVIAITFIAKCFFWFTFSAVAIIIIFAIAGLFCLVMADVFQQAVLYKEENDLTV